MMSAAAHKVGDALSSMAETVGLKEEQPARRGDDRSRFGKRE
jgi:hypothetical protein